MGDAQVSIEPREQRLPVRPAGRPLGTFLRAPGGMGADGIHAALISVVDEFRRADEEADRAGAGGGDRLSYPGAIETDGREGTERATGRRLAEPKPRVLKVHVHPADLGTTGHIRLAWPAQLLAAAGHDVELFDPGPLEDMPEVQVEHDGQRIIRAKLMGEPACDVVVMQRLDSWSQVASVMALRNAGVRVIVDIDDDLGSLHAKHPGFTDLNPSRNSETNWHHVAAACREASLVTCTTPALAQRYGSHGRVAIIPNCIPKAYLDARKTEDGPVTVGWPGFVRSHPGDLDVTRGAVQRAIAGTGARYRAIGLADGVKEALGLIDEPEVVAGVGLDGYAAAIAQLDVGLAPLAVNRFNQAKSALKCLDLSACGVPFVCSPTDPYLDYCKQGVGFVARQPKHWEAMVRRLIKEPSLRAEQSVAGREVASRWTLEENAWRWAEIWLASND